MLKILFGIEYNDFLTIRKILTDEFINIDIEELLQLLNNIDILYLEYERKKANIDKILITTLRNKIFDLDDKKIHNSYETPDQRLFPHLIND